MAINWNSFGGVHNGVTSLANKAEGFSGQTLAGVPVELLQDQSGNGGHRMRQYNIDNTQQMGYDKAGAQNKLDTDKAQFTAWGADDKRLRNLGFTGIMDQSMYNTWLDTAGNASLLSEAEANGGMTPALYNSLITADKNKKKSNKLGIKLLKVGLGLAGGALAGGFVGGSGLAGSGGSLSGLTAGGTLGSAGVAGSGAAGLATGSGLASVAGGLGGLNVGGTAVSNTGAIFGTPTSSIGATGLTGGSTIGATGAGGGLANTSGGIFESIKSGFSSIKDAASTLSTGKDIVGGLLDLKNGIDAKKQAEGLQASAVPDPTSDRVRAQLEAFFNDPSLADVDQRWLDQLAKDYTRNASAQHGVDSGAYVEGLINVLNRGRKEWLESREGAGRGLLTNSQLIAEGNFNRQSNAASWQIDANTLFNRGASGTVAGALDFIFG